MKKAKYPEIGKRIREAREKAGKTQTDCKTLLGDVSISTISDWENGYAFPSVPYLKKISEKFKVSIDCLVFGEDPGANGDGAPTVKDAVETLLWLYRACGFTWHVEKKGGAYVDFNACEEPYKFRMSTKNPRIMDFFVKYIRLEKNKDIMTEKAYNDSLKSLMDGLPNAPCAALAKSEN